MILELSLVQSSGLWFKPGMPILYCWFHAVHVQDTPDEVGRVLVVRRDQATGTWREFTRPVTISQSREILSRLEDLGLPGRAPNVEGVPDTSDGWARVVFWVRTHDGARCMVIDMESSGFEGGDAEPLRRLYRRLFELAGFSDFWPSIYGQVPGPFP